MSDIEEEKPVYKVGDILVVTTFNGRSTDHFFFKVVSFTNKGAPKVVTVPAIRVTNHNDSLSSSVTVTPDLANAGGIVTAMRWYKDGYYCVQGLRVSGSCSYTATDLY